MASKYGPLKRGTKRADGKIFFAYSSGREMWYDEATYYKKLSVLHAYEEKAKREFQKKKHPILWQFDPHKKLYYAGRTGAKEKWVTEEECYTLKKKKERNHKTFRTKTKATSSNKFKVGDRHPNDNNLFYACANNHRPCWKTKTELDIYLKARRASSTKCTIRNRIRKQNILKKFKSIIKRGAEQNNLIFWDYTSLGKEIWLTPEEFKRRRMNNIEKTRRYRIKKKQI